MARHRFGAAAALLAAALLAGCGSGPAPAGSPSDRRLVVFAAASLQRPFTDIGGRFEAANPGTDVEFSFAGSADLVTQLTQGAPADVFASADTATMARAASAGLVSGDPVDFASNTLTIVVAPGNPERITGLKDLARPDISTVMCAPQVPCGSAARKAAQAAGVQLDPVSEESRVNDVLNKVTTGQADAGLVYVTDALGAGDKVTAVPFPESSAAVNTYPIAVLAHAGNPALARRFVDFVAGEDGQIALAAAGFGKP